MSNPNDDEFEAREEAYALLDAMELAQPHERLALAIRAVRADPTLSDGYAAAASAMAQDSLPALAAWLAAKEITRRDAGVSLERDAGQLWSVMQARPYLRASVGHALCALENGDHDEAIAQLNQLLVLDTDDRIGARYALGPALLLDGRHDAFATFRLTQTADEMAEWLYADAYHAVATKAPVAERRARLKRALARNAHVPFFLTAEDALQNEPADSYAPGSSEEAHAIACSITGRLWRNDRIALQALFKARA
jgi:tetratricopeptide (TPR) repeat protein